MSTFVGRKDGREIPAEFISDIQMAARICNATYVEAVDRLD